MKNNIPVEILQEFEKKTPNTKRLSEVSIKFIDEYYSYYNMCFDYKNFNQKIFLTFKLMKNGVSEIPLCGYNGCKKQKMIVKISGNVSNGCCRSHAMQNTNIEKYGVNCTTKVKEIRIKQEETCLKNHGVRNPSQNKQLRQKQKKSCLKNHGVEYPQQSKIIREKTKKTNIRNHGNEWNMQSKQCLEKRKETYLKKYGVDSSTKSDIIKQKIINNNIKKYGVENVMQHPEISEKQQKACYKFKEYKWKTGEVSNVQGYEPIILSELEEKGYSFRDVLTSRKEVPTIKYIFEGKERVYFPDIFIPEENLIIEVKSDYTLNMELEKNNAKFVAVKEAGYNFALEIR